MDSFVFKVLVVAIMVISLTVSSVVAVWCAKHEEDRGSEKYDNVENIGVGASMVIYASCVVGLLVVFG